MKLPTSLKIYVALSFLTAIGALWRAALFAASHNRSIGRIIYELAVAALDDIALILLVIPAKPLPLEEKKAVRAYDPAGR